MRRYGLRDEQWESIKDMLPGRKEHVGGTAKDNRLFIVRAHQHSAGAQKKF